MQSGGVWTTTQQRTALLISPTVRRSGQKQGEEQDAYGKKRDRGHIFGSDDGVGGGLVDGI